MKKNENQMKSVLDTKSILVVAVIVSTFTSWNLYLHRTDVPLGYSRYDGCGGFTLDYSHEMQLRFGPGDESNIRESDGSIQLAKQGNTLELFGVMWADPDTLPSHLRNSEGLLEYVGGIAGMEGNQIINLGDIGYTVQNNHELIYQTFDLVEQGFDLPVLIGATHCEETDKYYWLYLVYLPDIEAPPPSFEAQKALWLEYIDNFNCHP